MSETNCMKCRVHHFKVSLCKEEFCKKFHGEGNDDDFVELLSEKKYAEWVYGENNGQDGWYCSKCGFFVPWYYSYYGLDNIDFIRDFHYCPNCGSDMRDDFSEYMNPSEGDGNA